MGRFVPFLLYGLVSLVVHKGASSVEKPVGISWLFSILRGSVKTDYLSQSEKCRHLPKYNSCKSQANITNQNISSQEWQTVVLRLQLPMDISKYNIK